MSVYSNNFYNAIRQGCIDSSREVAPAVYSMLMPATVIDVGCGEGHWGKAFEELGADVVGMDGDYVKEPVIAFEAHDLRKPFPFDRLPHNNFDLAVNLEVAEHLPASRAESFVHDLCQLSDNILFSAAIPSQGGVDHINERWFSSYWYPMFKALGYESSGLLRYAIWDNPKVEWWYKQNLMFITKNPAEFPSLFPHPIDPPIDLVHPTLWESRVK